jgi:hypothetical protein
MCRDASSNNTGLSRVLVIYSADRCVAAGVFHSLCGTEELTQWADRGSACGISCKTCTDNRTYYISCWQAWASELDIKLRNNISLIIIIIIIIIINIIFISINPVQYRMSIQNKQYRVLSQYRYNSKTEASKYIKQSDII